MAGYIKPQIREFVSLAMTTRRRNALIRVIKAQALWDTSQTHSKLSETELSVARAVMLAYYTMMESSDMLSSYERMIQRRDARLAEQGPEGGRKR